MADGRHKDTTALKREDVDTPDKALAAVQRLLKLAPDWRLFHFVEDAGDRLVIGVALAGAVFRMWPRYKGVLNRARLAYVFRELLYDLSHHGLAGDLEGVVALLDSLLVAKSRGDPHRGRSISRKQDEIS
jgi:hypothetical protein